jgi:hypothetical protein
MAPDSSVPLVPTEMAFRPSSDIAHGRNAQRTKDVLYFSADAKTLFCSRMKARHRARTYGTVKSMDLGCIQSGQVGRLSIQFIACKAEPIGYHGVRR